MNDPSQHVYQLFLRFHFSCSIRQRNLMLLNNINNSVLADVDRAASV